MQTTPNSVNQYCQGPL